MCAIETKIKETVCSEERKEMQKQIEDLKLKLGSLEVTMEHLRAVLSVAVNAAEASEDETLPKLYQNKYEEK